MKRFLPWLAAWVVLAVVFSAGANLLQMRPASFSGTSGPTFFNVADQTGGFTTPTTNYANDTSTNSVVSGWRIIRTNVASPAKTSGKWHFEIQVPAYDDGSGWSMGISNNFAMITGDVLGHSTNNNFGFVLQGSIGATTHMSGSYNSGGDGGWDWPFALNHWLAVELDLNSKIIWWQDATAGTGWSRSAVNDFAGNPAAGTGGNSLAGLITTGGIMIACSSYNQTPPGIANNDQCVLNPGVVTSGHAFVAPISAGFTAWDH